MMPVRALKLETHQALLGEGAIDAQVSHRGIGELGRFFTTVLQEEIEKAR